MIDLPAMPAAQTASGHGLLDLYEKPSHDWTLIGGLAYQMSNLFTASQPPGDYSGRGLLSW